MTGLIGLSQGHFGLVKQALPAVAYMGEAAGCVIVEGDYIDGSHREVLRVNNIKGAKRFNGAGSDF